MNKKIDECFCWVIDVDGEGIPAFSGPGGMTMPMMGADIELGLSMRYIAQQAADESGKPIELRRFKGPYEVVDVIHPST